MSAADDPIEKASRQQRRANVFVTALLVIASLGVFGWFAVEFAIMKIGG